MPRTLSLGLADHISGKLLTLANCLKIVRTDGQIFGFTSFDNPIIYLGTRYECMKSIKASALRSTSDAGVDNMETVGVLSSDRIMENDLRGGRFDFADIYYFTLNWSDLSQGALNQLRGKIGEVTLADGQYTAEMRSLSQLLKMQLGYVMQYNCIVQRLGDSMCKVNIASYTSASQTVQSVTNANTFVCTDAALRITNSYHAGVARFRTGLNASIERDIKNSTLSGNSQTIQLREGFPFVVNPGDVLDLEMGCNRLFSTCNNTFHNTINYRGFPHLPGSDRLIQTGRIPG